jgi:hypothetical protein
LAGRISQTKRYGLRAVGLQFHPEVTYHMICRWTHRRAERLTRPGALSRPEHFGGWFQHDGRVAAWLDAFLRAWLEGGWRSQRGKGSQRTRNSAATSGKTSLRASAQPFEGQTR